LAGSFFATEGTKKGEEKHDGTTDTKGSEEERAVQGSFRVEAQGARRGTEEAERVASGEARGMREWLTSSDFGEGDAR